MSKSLLSLAAMVVAIAIPYQALAISLRFDENDLPDNNENGFTAFTHNDFMTAGAVTDGPTSIILDIVDSDNSNGVFGGLGVDFVKDDGSGNFLPQQFDANSHRWELNVKILPNNTATEIRASFIDDDAPGTADEHVYGFDLTSVPNDGEFHLLTTAIDPPLFTQGAFGFSPGDGVVNPDLRQIQIQSVFGSTGRLNVEIDFIQIVPEPTSACLALLGGLATCLMSTRRVR